MASVKDDHHYHCTLDQATLAKAKKELGENPHTRLLEVNNLRQRLGKVPGLKPRLDVEFLLPFLRARKFDQERTFDLVKRHYQEKKDRHEHFDDIKPSLVRHLIEGNFMEVLRHRDKDSCRVLIVRPGLWDPDRCPLADGLKMLFLVLSKLAQEEETQVHGLHVIDQLDKVTWKQASHFTPGVGKLLASTLQDMVPLRLKRYDIVNQPTFFDLVFPLLKNFLKDKVVQREWMPELLASEKDFEFDNKFGYVTMTLENSKKENNKPDAGLQGLGGTFKKLDI